MSPSTNLTDFHIRDRRREVEGAAGDRKLNSFRRTHQQRLHGHGPLRRFCHTLTHRLHKPGIETGTEDPNVAKQRLHGDRRPAWSVHRSTKRAAEKLGANGEIGDHITAQCIGDPVEIRVGWHNHVDVGVHRLNLRVRRRFLSIDVKDLAVRRIDDRCAGDTIEDDRAAEHVHRHISVDVRHADARGNPGSNFDVHRPRYAKRVRDAARPRSVVDSGQNRANEPHVAIAFEADDRLLATILERGAIRTRHGLDGCDGQSRRIASNDLDVAEWIVDPDRVGRFGRK